MAGSFDACDPGLREETPDHRLVGRLDIGGVSALDKERRSPILASGRQGGEARKLRKLALEFCEVQAPMGFFFVDEQVLQQERARGRIRNRSGKLRIGVAAARYATEIDVPHCTDKG